VSARPEEQSHNIATAVKARRPTPRCVVVRGMVCFRFLIFSLLFILSLDAAQTRECKPPIWGLPDPFQIELQVPHLPLKEILPLKIALITAGSLRSFTFVEKSWKKYLITPWKDMIHIFAHIIALPECHISAEGLPFLKSIASDIEITHSTKLLIPIQELLKQFPSRYQEPEFLSQFLTPQRGNYLDMYYRRHRAYLLSQRYSQRHQITWDLIMFLRPDTAFYAPVVNLPMFHHSLLTWKQQQSSDPSSSSSSSSSSPPRHPIYIPESCNFYGVCDRLAIGLPQEMEIYFQKNFFLKVMSWAAQVSNTSKASSLYCPMKSCFSISEDLLECWFLMNSLTQVFYARPIPLTFVTLRSLYAMDYCNSSRQRYVTEVPTPYFAESDSDKEMARVGMSREYEGEDLIGSVEMRCGKRFVGLNLSSWCDESIMRCSCGDRNRWGTA
jgi:hypothetical protein